MSLRFLIQKKSTGDFKVENGGRGGRGGREHPLLLSTLTLYLCRGQRVVFEKLPPSVSTHGSYLARRAKEVWSQPATFVWVLGFGFGFGF